MPAYLAFSPEGYVLKLSGYEADIDQAIAAAIEPGRPMDEIIARLRAFDVQVRILVEGEGEGEEEDAPASEFPAATPDPNEALVERIQAAHDRDEMSERAAEWLLAMVETGNAAEAAQILDEHHVGQGDPGGEAAGDATPRGDADE